MINTVSQTVQGYSSLILNTISTDHLSDPCSPNPCLNDGTCFSSSDSNPSYICVCVNGYTETNCQTCELYLHILQVLVIHVVIVNSQYLTERGFSYSRSLKPRKSVQPGLYVILTLAHAQAEDYSSLVYLSVGVCYAQRKGILTAPTYIIHSSSTFH